MDRERLPEEGETEAGRYLAARAMIQIQAEAEAYLAARAARVPRGRALEILARAGTQEPIPEDRFDGN